MKILPSLVFVVFATTLRAEPSHQFPPLKASEIESITSALPPKATADPKKARKVLVFFLTEGYVHESIPYGNEALRQLGERTGAYQADFSDDRSVLNAESLKQYDAIIFNNTSHLKITDPAAREALLGFLKEGKGMVGIHAALSNFADWPEAQECMGGAFANHPWEANSVVAVKIDDPGHVLTQSFDGKGFWVREELYQVVGPYGRDRQRVLLSLDMSHEQNRRDPKMIKRTDNDFPVSWAKDLPAGGRVFYTSFGHNPDIFSQPRLLRHFLDGIQYALGDLPADAAPSSTLQPAPTPALAPSQPAPINGPGQ